jgi:hypothetical protein
MFPKRVIYQNEVQKKLMIVISSFLCIFALKAIFITSAEAQTTFDETQKIKTLLLRPAGWMVDWTGPSNTGLADWKFEARGEKVVVKIHNHTPWISNCEQDVTFISDVAKFDACASGWGIELRFDPKDQEYPFKGKNPKGYQFKLKEK